MSGRGSDPAMLDIIHRLSRSSYSSNAHSDDGDLSPVYQIGSTPETSDVTGSGDHLERGADSTKSTEPLPDGPPKIPLRDPRWAGLIVHSVAIGLVSTVLPLTIFPFLTAYLNMEGTQTLSARTLLAVPWLLRPFFRVLTECVPLVFGFHFRPYMVLGWLICSASLVTIYFIDIPDPYFRDQTLKATPLGKLTSQELTLVNQDAPNHGALYVMLMTFATMGYVLADVASDALVADVANKYFPALEPGQESPFVPAVTTQRYMAMLFSFLFMGFGMSGWHYGGDFDFTLTYNEVMLITGVVAFIPVPCAWLLVAEGVGAGRSFRGCFHQIWKLFENRAINYIIACRFLGGIFGGISATPVNPVALNWANVQPLNDNVVSFVATAAVIGLVTLADKKGWVINYRLTIIGANIVLLLLDCGATMFTIWNLVRSQWFWIGLPVMEALPSGLDYVILSVILGEIAEPGTEELMRGIITAVSFLATPVGLTITKYVDAQFDLTNQDLFRDTTSVRVDATVVFIIAYICQLLSLAWLFALPRDNEAREWKKRSGSSTLYGVALIVVLVASLGWSITVHVLSVISSTSCLGIAGGKGC